MKPKTIEYDGKTYPSIQALYDELKPPMSVRVFRLRLSQGMDIKTAIEKPLMSLSERGKKARMADGNKWLRTCR
jgi:hypothetical protein